MPAGRPQDYKVYGKPSSGIKASAKASSTARSRSHGQRGAAMRNNEQRVTTPVIRPPGTPTRNRMPMATTPVIRPPGTPMRPPAPAPMPRVMPVARPMPAQKPRMMSKGGTVKVKGKK